MLMRNDSHDLRPLCGGACCAKEFLIAQRPRFVEYAVRGQKSCLHRAPAPHKPGLRFHPKTIPGRGPPPRCSGHQVSVPATLDLARFGGAAQRLRSPLSAAGTLHSSSSPHSFVQRRAQFFEVLRAVAARVAGSLRCRTEICCRCRANFSPSAYSCGGGNQVSARMLRNVHSGIGDADDVFDRKSMHGETGHAETSGNVMLVSAWGRSQSTGASVPPVSAPALRRFPASGR